MIKRGQIYYIENTALASGSEQHSGRPAIIVSNDKNNQNSEIVEVVYLTTQPKNDLPTHVRINSTNRVSTALCEQVTTVSVNRIGNYLCSCSEQEMMNVDISLAISLGIDFDDLKDAKEKYESQEVEKHFREHEDHNENNNSEDYIKVCAELEVYKHQYEWLVDRFLKSNK